MLTKGYYFGIKSANQDLGFCFDKILSSNPSFLITGSFSYGLPRNLWFKFSSLNCPKLILLPFQYNFSNQTNLSYQINNIKSLIKANTVVLINSLNHSKFMLTKKYCFIGSNNLTQGGIVSNIESSMFMNNSHVDYNDWKNEIINLIRPELNQYASLKNTQAKEKHLSSLTLPKIKFKMTPDELSEAINQLASIYNALISVTDSYQHLGDVFKELAKQTKKPVKLMQSSLLLLTKHLYDDLTEQYNRKSVFSEILIKDCDKINEQIERLSISVNKVSLYRENLLEDYNTMWTENQKIYKVINKDYANLNLINLNNFKDSLNNI